MKKIISGALFFLIALGFANRGEYPFDPGVEIFEPVQRAMIAWNGEEEILLLSTDLSASDSTMVLEVMPLPAEPAVKKGDGETFRKAVALINQWQAMHGKKNGGRAAGETRPVGEITFHEKIGAHDISVARVLAGDRFVEWVRDYLKTFGAKEDVIGRAAKKIIEEYIADGFTWFVFDVIELKNETVTNEPIQYRFQTRSLYYPLRVSQSVAGNTEIELMILTPGLLNHFPGIPYSAIELAHDPVSVTADQLAALDQDMHELLSGIPEMKLRIWRISGDAASFDQDLLAD